jgi:hypothetical protein
MGKLFSMFKELGLTPFGSTKHFTVTHGEHDIVIQIADDAERIG